MGNVWSHACDFPLQQFTCPACSYTTFSASDLYIHRTERCSVGDRRRQLQRLGRSLEIELQPACPPPPTADDNSDPAAGLGCSQSPDPHAHHHPRSSCSCPPSPLDHQRSPSPEHPAQEPLHPLPGAEEDYSQLLHESLQQYILQDAVMRGDVISDETAAGLATMACGVLEQELDAQELLGNNEELEALRDFLGVDMDPDLDAADEDEQQDPAELARLRANLSEPLHPGSPFTTEETVVIQLLEKRKARIQDTYFNNMCLWNNASRPPGNNFPRSLYLMEKLAGVKDLREVQKHMCPNDCKMFDDLQPHEYAAHVNEHCECGGPRFEVKVNSKGRRRILPTKVMYWFGLGNVIRDLMFTDPNFCKRRGTGRDQYYYPSEEAARLHERAGASLQDPDTSAYEVGVDWGQMFISKVHSTGFIMVRCADMPLSHLNRRCFSHIVGIIPGPKEPSNIDPYLQPLLQEFKQHGPQGEPLEVTEYKHEDGVGTSAARTFGHTLLLSGTFGDSPGIKKLAHWLSHAGYLGCGYCLLRGTRVGAMYFKGYFEPTGWGHFVPGEVKEWGAHHKDARKGYCGDADLKLSHVDQKARADLVDGNGRDRSGEPIPPANPHDLGCHGMSPFVKELDYVDYNNLFVVPIAHAGLCGVVKDFWNMVLTTMPRGQQAAWYVMPAWARKVVESRQDECVPTVDFGRKYTDILSKKGNWTMEDWLHWTEAWSVVVLRPDPVQGDLLPLRLRQMWRNLRSGLLYFCRSNPTPGVATTAHDAAACLRQYASLLEQHAPLSMLKFNLHLLVCRLFDQEVARGRAAHSTEYWVENLIQWAKSTVRYRTTKYPELLLASDILVDCAIAVRLATVPHLRDRVLGWRELYCGSRAAYKHADSAGEDGTILLGTGCEARGAKKVEAVAAVQGYIRAWQPEGWEEGMVAEASVLWYAYASVRGLELLHSTSYDRARSRVSYNILCKFIKPDEQFVSTYIARVKYFVKVTPDAGAGVAPLRLAVADLFVVENADWGAGVVYHASGYPSTPTIPACAVSMGVDANGLGVLYDKHAMALSDEGAWFMPYSNMSASGEAD